MNSIHTESTFESAIIEHLSSNGWTKDNTYDFSRDLALVKITQNTMKKAYSFVPLQDFTEPWTNEMLYKKYRLTKEEIDFIESKIRPMEVKNE